MNRQVRSAMRRDRLLQDAEEATMIVRGVVQGQDAPGTKMSEHQKVLLTWIGDIRIGFAGIVVRRTHKSVDNHGRHLFGLPPLEENTMLLELYAREYANLESIADRLTDKQSRRATTFAEGDVSDFQLFLLFCIRMESFLMH
jgi:hypothetical protein